MQDLFPVPILFPSSQHQSLSRHRRIRFHRHSRTLCLLVQQIFYASLLSKQCPYRNFKQCLLPSFANYAILFTLLHLEIKINYSHAYYLSVTLTDLSFSLSSFTFTSYNDSSLLSYQAFEHYSTTQSAAVLANLPDGKSQFIGEDGEMIKQDEAFVDGNCYEMNEDY